MRRKRIRQIHGWKAIYDCAYLVRPGDLKGAKCTTLATSSMLRCIDNIKLTLALTLTPLGPQNIPSTHAVTLEMSAAKVINSALV